MNREDKIKCDWCTAQIVEHEHVVCISRYAVRRLPKRFTVSETYFDSGEQELSFHERCLADNCREIMEHLYPAGAERPLKTAANSFFPMLRYPT